VTRALRLAGVIGRLVPSKFGSGANPFRALFGRDLEFLAAAAAEALRLVPIHQGSAMAHSPRREGENEPRSSLRMVPNG